GVILADLEPGDCLASFGDDRLLAGDLGHVADSVLDDLLVCNRFRNTHVQGDFRNAGNLHHTLVPELLGEFRNNLGTVDILKTSHFCPYYAFAPTTSPVERKMRTFLPSCSLTPMRSALPVAGLKMATFETWIGMVFSTIPPCSLRIGLGLACFLATFTPSTST